MQTVLTCLTQAHDPGVVALAALLCLAGAATAMRLLGRARDLKGGLWFGWVLLTGTVAGTSVWSTHFIAMLAFDAGSPAGFGLIGTVVSFAVAIAGHTLAFGLASRARNRLERGLSGVVLGAAVGSMHFLGMAAYQVSAHLSWDMGLVAAALLSGTGLAVAAMITARPGMSLRRGATAVGMMISAVVALHFISMGALILTPDPTLSFDTGQLSREALIGITGGLSATLLMAGIVISVMDAWANRAATGRLVEALNAMSDGLAIYDAHDRLILWNASLGQVDPSLTHLIRRGTPFSRILRYGLERGDYPDAVGREDDWLANRLAQRASGCDLEQALSDGRWLRIRDRKTGDGGTISVVVDVTDLKRDAEALAQARDAAEQANRAKSEFLANMSHEIRTPLNGVLGVAEALRGTPLTAQQTEMLDLVSASGETLQHLLSDILDLARIESGRLSLTPVGFDLPRVLKEAVHLYGAQAEAKGLQFYSDIAPEAEVFVEGDVVRLKQILTNLVSNAVKFTHHGFVRLTASRAADQSGRAVFRFTVEDTGVGFDAVSKARLFARFEQADGSITRRFGGSGLGLAISRQLTEMMGGSLDCESEPDGGSTFILTVPLPLAEAPALAEADPVPTTTERSEISVLVADDHPTNRKVIELILGQAGVRLTCVENGAQALDAIDRERFDLVLMDMQMPVMDGLSATAAIRDLEGAEGRGRTPVVMLTANALPEHVQAAMAAGADRHLAKPISAPLLLATLSEMISAAADVEAREQAA